MLLLLIEWKLRLENVRRKIRKENIVGFVKKGLGILGEDVEGLIMGVKSI